MTSLRETLRAAVADALGGAVAAGDLRPPEGASLPEIRIERPARPEHGDFSTNAAMQLAPLVHAAPMQIAEVLRAHLGTPSGVGEVSVAPPGFINLRLDPAWVAGSVAAIREGGPEFGRVQAATPHRINVEFVSANPTGPLTVGNARGAFVGDLLSRVLEAVGHEVTREYYFNDFNAQVRANANPSFLPVGKTALEAADDLFPRFIITILPAGISGLIIAGLLAEANLSGLALVIDNKSARWTQMMETQPKFDAVLTALGRPNHMAVCLNWNECVSASFVADWDAPPNDMVKGVSRILDMASTYYVLGYEPPEHAGKPGFRKIRVEVARKDLKVNARRGYFDDGAPGPAR
jgi:hypothetical protein